MTKNDGMIKAGGALMAVPLALTLAAPALPAQAEAAHAEEAQACSDEAGATQAEAAEKAAAIALDAAQDKVDALAGPARQAEQAREGIAQAEKEEKAAQCELDDAQAKASAAQASASSAQSAYDAAASKAATSDEQIAKGSLGFFEAVGAHEYAISLLTYRLENLGSPYADYTRMGEEGDATSLANMKLALERMAKVNDLRRAEGLTELKIIDSLMAQAQVRTNYSKNEYGHMPYLEYDRESFDKDVTASGIHTNTSNFACDENLAYDYEDPFTGWYDAEKSYGGGHYKNIVYAENRFYGCATAQGPQGSVDEQAFDRHKLMRAEVEYTASEYYERFMSYYDGLLKATDARDAAAEELARAKTSLDDANAAVSAAQAKVDSAQAARDAAEKSLAEAEPKAAENAGALAAAQGELDAAKAAYKAAHAEASAERAAGYAASPFADVDGAEWYAGGVAYCAANAVMSGYDGGLFGAGDTLTRGQLATILWRVARPGAAASYDAATAVNESAMPDVEGGKYYTAAANWAASKGVINGFEEGDHREFRPDEAVTMEQLACILANFEGLADEAEAMDGVAEALEAAYDDSQAISTWARSSAALGTQRGWFAGYDNGDGTRSLRPGEAITRARAATLLANMKIAEAEHV